MPTESATETIKVLLIEDNRGDARLMLETLSLARNTQFECASFECASFEIESLDRFASGVDRLRRPGVDVVLLDLSLPDSQGLEAIARLHAQAPEIPIVALAGIGDDSIVPDAVKHGAEDCLIKGAFTPDLLVRSIRYATDRQRAREDLARARDSALESARMRAEFLANMSHEIRTPLNGVIGMTRLLIDTPVNPDQLEMLEIARTSAYALLKIVNDILDFSKISAGKAVLEDADFDLGTAVESVVQIFTEQAHAKGVILDSFIDGDVEMRLRGDSGRLCQVLTNLIGNAVKFTADGFATIRVERIGGSTNQSTLRFQVRDTGIGIPLDGQRNIFQAFIQAEGSTTRRFGGTGLGLAISAQLVELMGGSIGVESELGRGSTFWFTAKFAHQSAVTIRDPGPDHLRLETVWVLLVDSNATSARVVSEHLRAWGMRCEIVATAAQALATLKRARAAGDPFEIAIIDLQLPDQSGLDLARAIKEIPGLAGVRVLGLYALGSRPDPSQTKATGIRALLGKPVRQSQLLNTLAALMAAQIETPPEPPGRTKLPRGIKSVIPAEIRQRIHILLVEDNLVNQQVEIRMIDRIGYHTEAAGNGRIALEKLAHTHFDIILMDCQMPEVDGYMATREIRRREGTARHIPIIGVTAHALPADREECLRAGMDDYIAKPVMPEDLAAIIDKWVEFGNTPRSPMTTPDAPPLQVATQFPNNRQIPAASVLDEAVLADLREYQNPGEPDFVTELIGVFDEDLTNRLAQISAGLQTGDVNRVRQAAHALKGASGELGAQRMREICSRLELSTAEGSIAAAPAMARELEVEALQVRAALATHCVETPARAPTS